MHRVAEIISSFEKHRNPEKAVRMSAYMRNKFIYYGIPTSIRRATYRNLLREEKKSKHVNWDFLEECWNRDEREFQYLVLDYLSTMQKYLFFEDIPRLEKFIRTKQWWDTIDAIDNVIGIIGLNDSNVDDLMLRWSKDDDFWVRRVAIDHQLSRRENTNTELLEIILVNNFGSEEFFINKAIGWSLREYSKTNPEWVRDFIKKYKVKMSSLSIREASKYL